MKHCTHLQIQSHKGIYTATLTHSEQLELSSEELATSHFIIDQKVAELYPTALKNILSSSSVLLIEATEKNKSLERLPQYVEHLVRHQLRRNQRLIAIGGGIIQDITCFLAANMLRGVDWWFYPTTLLAQADSCVGSKSSINCGNVKNILGTFTPPKKIFIHDFFRRTLALVDIRSGIGEMLKVHAIAGLEAFNAIAKDYAALFTDANIMEQYLYRSLEIKKNIIEQDEFDQDIRQVMNYGHSFGHAIESATDYKIPHGVAVTIGMDMANYVALQSGLTTESYYQTMHPILKTNYVDFTRHDIPLEKFLSAILKDKKNLGDQMTLILPNHAGVIGRRCHDNNSIFHTICQNYLATGRL